MAGRTSITRIAATIVAVVLLALPLGNLAAQTQEFTPESYTSVLTDFEITVSGPDFAITDAALEHYRTGEGEVVTIESTTALVEVSFFDDEDTPDDSLDAYLGNVEAVASEFEVVDRASSGDVYHAYAVFSYEDVDMIFYAQVSEDVVGNVDLFEMIITPAADFEDDLAAAQSEIDIDGIAFLADVDGSALIGGESGTDDIDEGSGLTGNPRDDARIGQGQATDPIESTPEVSSGDDSRGGVLTDSSWEGPVFGHVFGWDPANWYIDPDQEGSIFTSEEEMVDSITLSADGWTITPYAYLAVIEDPAHTPADYLDYWSSDDYVLSVLIGEEEGDYEVLASRSRTDGVGVVILYTINGTEYVRVNQMIDLGDGTLFMSQIDTSVEEIVEVYDAAMLDLTLNGDALPQILTTRQVERAVGE